MNALLEEVSRLHDARPPATPAQLDAFEQRVGFRDGNYVLLDVSQQHDGRYPLRDGFREGFPDPTQCPQIASSFSEFLAGALRSNGRWFWLKKRMQDG
ncbi:SMI1/KNR4 family protein [Corallococcus sp. AB045]|uniref:SMI1/KNR4 family protein n=1 Tax=Corallococcus sp. AB045 TaxID=2316719 RepID=UPI000ED808A6|nr:SMI1/KNR4 family protein [Corallococcus sp. AB045]RKH91952.1 SMI1/KNR4 family protein [Corallococcus sp. AB045]